MCQPGQKIKNKKIKNRNKDLDPVFQIYSILLYPDHPVLTIVDRLCRNNSIALRILSFPGVMICQCITVEALHQAQCFLHYTVSVWAEICLLTHTFINSKLSFEYTVGYSFQNGSLNNF